MQNKKVVMITGCSSGIGRELCAQLANRGYIVAATARDVNTIEDLQADIKLALDVTNRESIDNAVNAVIARYQKIDVLINNAGYSVRGAMEEISLKSMKSMFDVNVFGIINMIQAVAPYMRQSGCGKIINIGSISGKFSQPINGAYCASKHAVEAISDALRYELHAFNIQVTVIEPGPISTNFFATMERQSEVAVDSAYQSLLSMDVRRKDKQAYTQTEKAAESLCNIIEKNKLKSRYELAVPYVYHMFARFPQGLRDYLMTNAR